VVLNEVMINAAGACDGSCTPSSGEWVELYNNDIFPVDVECYIITDGDFSVTLPAGTIIPGNGFLVIGSSNSGVPVNIDLATCGCVTGPNSQVGIYSNGGEQLLLFDALGTITDGIVWGGGQWSQQTFFTTNTIGNCSSTTVPINPNFPQIQTVPAQSLYDGQSVFRSCDGAGSWALGTYPATAGQSNNSMNGGNLNTINSFVDDSLHYLSDLNSCQYFNILVSDMSNASLTDINEIVSVNVNMEHSYLGDLDITLYCPSGQSIILHQNGNPQFSVNYPGAGTFLGEPIDIGGATDFPGVGWDYSWSPGSTLGTWISNVASGTVGTLPSGNYNSIEPFSDLLGCPINGVWTIEFCDLWGIDDGWLFNWGLEFNNSINTSAQSIYDTISWQGNTLIWDDGNGNAYFSADQYGPNEYSVLATLSNGCVLSDTISIEAVGPIISLVPEINTCSLPVALNPTVQGGADYVSWTYFNNPTVLSQYNTLNTLVLQQPSTNTYELDVTSYSNGLYCRDSSYVVVNFVDASILLQPVSAEANLGDNVYFSCIASSGATYQWQILANGVWTNLFNAGQFSGVNTSQLSVSNVNLNNVNQQFQCVISSPDGGCTDTSNSVSINFCDIASSSIPSVLNVSLNSSPNITITPITNGATYQWQSNIGFGWMNISDGANYVGTSTPNLQILTTDWQNENEWLQCIVTTNLCSDTTNICVVHITPTGVDEMEGGSIYYYENAIHFSKISAALGQRYFVFDGSGKLVSEGVYLGDQTIDLDLVSSGVYCFKLGDRIIKFVKVN
jgi:subtilisin-like proprotein convertase family protein